MGKPTHKRVPKPDPSPTPLASKIAASASSASTSGPPSAASLELPLHHFYSKIGLQLLAIAFTASSASSRLTGNTSLSPTKLWASFIRALIVAPGNTLSTICGGVAVIQIWYGAWARGLRVAHAKAGAKVTKAGEQAKKKGFAETMKGMIDDAKRGKAPRLEEMQSGKKLFDLDFSYIGIAGVVTLAAALVLHAVAVLLGAPLFTRVKETFLLSFLVAQLAIAPIAIAVPPTERYVWLRMFSSLAPANDLELALVAPAIGTVIGSWLGAVPIPLDWDRPWQAWPTTCVVGAVVGHFVGSAVAVALVSRNATKSPTAVAEETKKTQ